MLGVFRGEGSAMYLLLLRNRWQKKKKKKQTNAYKNICISRLVIGLLSIIIKKKMGNLNVYHNSLIK